MNQEKSADLQRSKSTHPVAQKLMIAWLLTGGLTRAGFAAATETVDAHNCEVFIDRVTIARQGTSQTGTYSFLLDFKVIDERLDAPLHRIIARTTENGLTTESEADPAHGLAFRLTYTLGTYLPVHFRTLEAEFFAETRAGTLYRIVPGTGPTFVFDENAYNIVKSQGTVWYDPYFNASSGTQESFGGYYNPHNCY
jgi:hypothetical protein